MNRRQFFLATAGAVTAGCNCLCTSPALARGERTVNAGAVSKYSADGVYDAFADLGFFVISKQGKLSVLSAICTHRTCKLTAEKDRTFTCECHGSTFDPGGKVTHGPAKRPLPALSSKVNEHQELIVTVPS